MNRLSEEKGQQAIAMVLRYGSRISTLMMALGLGLMLLRGLGRGIPNTHRLSLWIAFAKLIHLDPGGLIEVGLLLLLLTPIFRILVAAVSFALQRDTRYVLISLGVLAVVLASFVLAIQA